MSRSVAPQRPDVVTGPLPAEVFGLHAKVIADPVAGSPLVVPIGTRAWFR